jgi:protein SCO1/2
MWPQEPDHVAAGPVRAVTVATVAVIVGLSAAAGGLQAAWRLPPEVPSVETGRETRPPSDLLDRATPEDALGRTVPLDTELVDDRGDPVSLGSLVASRPTLLVLAWYRCPQLCGLVGQGLGGLRAALGDESWSAVTVSFDPADRPGDAARARARDGADWPYAVARDVGSLTRTLAFDAQLEPTGQWRHPAVVYVLTAEGRVSAVLPGVRPEPAVVRQALATAEAGKVAAPFDGWIDTCLRWDPASRLHGGAVLAALRVGALASGMTIALVVGLLVRLSRRRRR